MKKGVNPKRINAFFVEVIGLYDQSWIREELNLFAREQNITDEKGHIFHFKTHQFRHTYAVKLINSGADILTVQELLAHASPEMTMRYARLLDNTKRKAFENAVKQGGFSFDLNGNCPYAEEPPCLTCNGGKPCKDLAVGFSEMDVAKYEIHIQSTSKMIEVAKHYGQEEILEKNQKNLERLQDIYNTIKGGNIILGRLERLKLKQGVQKG